VPVQAVWAGGLDGGSFVTCEIEAVRKTNKCVVYNDFTGQVMEQGEFRLKTENRAARNEELKYAWADWGGMIGLSDGRVLARVYLPSQ
jgi:hypothetical protein